MLNYEILLKDYVKEFVSRVDSRQTDRLPKWLMAHVELLRQTTIAIDEENERKIAVKPPRINMTMNSSEAIICFMAWLTSRKESVAVGAKEDCSIIADKIGAFRSVNRLPEARGAVLRSYQIPRESENER